MTQPDMLVDGDAGSNDPADPAKDDRILAEAMIAPGSRMIGNTIDHIASLTGAQVQIVGLQRRDRMTRAPMREVLLEPGDLVLLVVATDDLPLLSQSRHIVVLEGTTRDLPTLKSGRHALMIFAGVVITAALGIVPIVVAAFTGAAAMIGFGCLNLR